MTRDQAPHTRLLDRNDVALLVLELQAKLVPAMFERPRSGQLHGDDSLRTARQEQHAGVQGAPALLEIASLNRS
jgi:hypothetical protein